MSGNHSPDRRSVSVLAGAVGLTLDEESQALVAAMLESVTEHLARLEALCDTALPPATTFDPRWPSDG